MPLQDTDPTPSFGGFGLSGVKSRHARQLRAIPGVIGLGVGMIYREGERTNEIGIIVRVDGRLPPEKVDPEGLIPTTIEGCAVSIIPTAAAPTAVPR